MNELILRINDDSFPISGRELHEALEIDTPYHKWFPRMAEYGFTEGTDFNPDKFVRVQNEGGRDVSREVTDHMMTLSMAKEIAMLQRTEKGREVRRYLIKVEEAWNSPEQIMARALQMAEATRQKLTAKVTELTAKIEQDAPKVLFADCVTASKDSILIGELAKILNQNGIDIGQNRLFRWLREHSYLMPNNYPTQKAMNLGLFEISERTISDPQGRVRITSTTRVTGKGQNYFVNKFLNERREKAECSAS